MSKASFLKASSQGGSASGGKRYKLKAGFTLIELLVVIAIIGILSSVVLASLNSARTKARDTKRVADIKQLQIALELYYDSNSKYPTNLTSLVGSSGGASLSVLPADPSGGAVNATGGYKYAINNATTPTAYHLGTTLEQTATQTTLEDADRDFSSSGASWVNDATSPDNSVPFDGNQDAITPIYDVSNQ